MSHPGLQLTIAVNDGSGYFTRYEYNNIGNITRMATGVPTATEALDRDIHSVTDYEYSYRGFLIGTTDPMGYTESCTYNSRGTMLTSTDKNGTLFEYTYNGAPWLLSKTATGADSSTQTVSYSYDYLGNVTQMVDENDTTLYTYDKLGNILTETRGTLVKEYGYDNNGNRTSTNITDGTFSHSLTYTYDSNNRLTKVVDDTTSTSYTYDKNNRMLTKKTYNLNGTVRAYAKLEYYDSGLLSTKKNYRHSTASTTYLIDDYALTYYADGNIASVDNNDVVTTYVYDTAGRLTSESLDDVIQASYTYDAFGNRATLTNSNGLVSYSYDKDNRLTQSAGTTYTYDNNGNLLSKSGTTTGTYSFDLFGRMSSATVNNTVSTYAYDGNGIRTNKTVGDITTNFINDGAYVVGEVSGDSIIKYTYGAGLISINNNDTVGYYHTDEHGNVSAISNLSRNIVADYDFDAFGNQTVTTADYYNPMRYCGEYYDAETGLIYLRARYYDPSIGRFITVDPIKDGTNWYVYCSNNPIAFVDPSGLYEEVINALSQMYSFKSKMDNNDDANHESIYAEAYAQYNSAKETIANSTVYIENWGQLQSALEPIVSSSTVSLEEISAAKEAAIKAYDEKKKSEFINDAVYTTALTVAIAPIVKMGISSTPSLSTTKNNIIVNLSNTAAKHMENPARYVPASILKAAIEHGVASPDPKGSRAIMYTIEMFKGNKPYTLEVLYDAITDTIWHFMYK